MGLFGKDGTMSASNGPNKMNQGANDLDRDPINKMVGDGISAVKNWVSSKPSPSPTPSASPRPTPAPTPLKPGETEGSLGPGSSVRFTMPKPK